MAAKTTTTTRLGHHTVLGGLGIVLTSAVASLLAFGPLDETVRIRWTIGYYYGPEHAPTLLVLTAFPVVLGGLYLGARVLGRYLERSQDLEDVDTFRTVYGICTLLLLATGLVSQLALILLNL